MEVRRYLDVAFSVMLYVWIIIGFITTANYVCQHSNKEEHCNCCFFVSEEATFSHLEEMRMRSQAPYQPRQKEKVTASLIKKVLQIPDRDRMLSKDLGRGFAENQLLNCGKTKSIYDTDTTQRGPSQFVIETVIGFLVIISLSLSLYLSNRYGRMDIYDCLKVLKSYWMSNVCYPFNFYKKFHSAIAMIKNGQMKATNMIFDFVRSARKVKHRLQLAVSAAFWSGHGMFITVMTRFLALIIENKIFYIIADSIIQRFRVCLELDEEQNTRILQRLSLHHAILTSRVKKKKCRFLAAAKVASKNASETNSSNSADKTAKFPLPLKENSSDSEDSSLCRPGRSASDCASQTFEFLDLSGNDCVTQDDVSFFDSVSSGCSSYCVHNEASDCSQFVGSIASSSTSSIVFLADPCASETKSSISSNKQVGNKIEGSNSKERSAFSSARRQSTEVMHEGHQWSSSPQYILEPSARHQPLFQLNSNAGFLANNANCCKDNSAVTAGIYCTYPSDYAVAQRTGHVSPPPGFASNQAAKPLNWVAGEHDNSASNVPLPLPSNTNERNATDRTLESCLPVLSHIGRSALEKRGASNIFHQNNSDQQDSSSHQKIDTEIVRQTFQRDDEEPLPRPQQQIGCLEDNLSKIFQLYEKQRRELDNTLDQIARYAVIAEEHRQVMERLKVEHAKAAKQIAQRSKQRLQQLQNAEIWRVDLVMQRKIEKLQDCQRKLQDVHRREHKLKADLQWGPLEMG